LYQERNAHVHDLPAPLATAVEAALGRSEASAEHLRSEVFAGLLADHCEALTPGLDPAADLVAGVES
jgi:hypothetical protein